MKIFTISFKHKKIGKIFCILLINVLFLFFVNNVIAQSGKLIAAQAKSTGLHIEASFDKTAEAVTDPFPIPQNVQRFYSGNENAHIAMAPGNDNCASATMASYTLTANGNCKYGTTAAATVEAGEVFGCLGGTTTASVWYSFIATQANMWLAIRPEPTATYFCSQNFGLRVYAAGVCPPTAAASIACKSNLFYSGSAINAVVNMGTLVAGNTYLVQVTPDPLCGNLYPAFCIRLDEPSTCNTCANICGPMCIWAGNPPTVTDITTTCPAYAWSPPMNQSDIQTNCYSFVATNDTVWLQQIVYSYCNPNTISFTYNLYNSGCGLIQSGNVFANNRITGLSIGTTYKICYTLQAACSWDSVAWPYAYTTSSTLPVELVSFGAMPYRNEIKIYWATASEENCKEFIIESTRNARDFTEVAHIKAAGNSTNLLNYKVFDNAPVKGNNYYRLKQVDFNGEFTYTKLISVEFSPSAVDLSIIPNPAFAKSTIRFNASGKFSSLLNITDMQGKTVYKKQFLSVEGINEYSLDLSEFEKGLYSLQLLVDDQNMITKLVKE